MKSSYVNFDTQDLGLDLEILVAVLLPRDVMQKNAFLNPQLSNYLLYLHQMTSVQLLQFRQPAVASASGLRTGETLLTGVGAGHGVGGTSFPPGSLKLEEKAWGVPAVQPVAPQSPATKPSSCPFFFFFFF